MRRMVRLSRCWRTGAALLAVGLATSCSVYRPLDQGSPVPWAQAYQRAGGTGLADGQAGVAPATLPGDGYVVRAGDRLGRLAEHFGLSVPELAQANDLQPPYIIRIGQVLRIPGQAPGAAPQETMVAKSGRGPTAVAAVEGAPLLPESVASEDAAKDQSA